MKPTSSCTNPEEEHATHTRSGEDQHHVDDRENHVTGKKNPPQVEAQRQPIRQAGTHDAGDATQRKTHADNGRTESQVPQREEHEQRGHEGVTEEPDVQSPGIPAEQRVGVDVTQSLGDRRPDGRDRDVALGVHGLRADADEQDRAAQVGDRVECEHHGSTHPRHHDAGHRRRRPSGPPWRTARVARSPASGPVYRPDRARTTGVRPRRSARSSRAAARESPASARRERPRTPMQRSRPGRRRSVGRTSPGPACAARDRRSRRPGDRTPDTEPTVRPATSRLPADSRAGARSPAPAGQTRRVPSRPRRPCRRPRVVRRG